MQVRKSLSIGVLLIALFFITAIFTGINWLDMIENISGGAALVGQVSQGQIHSLFLEKQMWANYPSVPASDKLIHIPTLVSTGVLLLIVCFLLGYRKSCSSVYVGLGCLGVGLIHYLVGSWVLSGNGVFGYSGLWVAVTLLGLLYSSIACALFAAMDILGIGIVKAKK